MKLVIFILTCFFPLSVSAGSNEHVPDYRLIILDFKFENAASSDHHLIKDLPETLEPLLAKYPDLVTLEREQHLEVLEEIEYQYDRPILFDQASKAQLKKQLGANIALVGKVRLQGDEIRIDAKIVEIETGVRLSEAYILVKAGSLLKPSTQLNPMKVLSMKLLYELDADFFEPNIFEIRTGREGVKVWFIWEDRKYEGVSDGTNSVEIEVPPWFFLCEDLVTYANRLQVYFSPGCQELKTDNRNLPIDQGGIDLPDCMR